MGELKVRIVKLEPMRVACAHGFGESPEGIANEKIEAFAKKRGITIDRKTVRAFGFNNPDPSPGSPNYGYDAWLMVGPDVEGDEDIEIIEFKGGLYAVTRFTGLEKIGQVWKQLVLWRENSEYVCGHHQWLEELLVPANTPFEEYTFDLYLPIAEPGGGGGSLTALLI